MAVLWHKTIDNTRYEVRSAGRTRRLYTNGVCHSDFNPVKIFTGSIWDLLLVPAWFYSPSELKRILILGVGGGSVLLQLQQLLDPDLMVGVERDPVHLYLAGRFFNVEGPGIELIEADAREWLDDYNGEPFDMIIDDLYIDEESEPVRAVAVDRHWSACLVRHLKPGGLLSINFGSTEELTSSALFRQKQYRQWFPRVFQMTAPMLDNHVGVFAGREVNSRMLRRHLMNHPLINRAITNRSLRYRIRQLV